MIYHLCFWQMKTGGYSISNNVLQLYLYYMKKVIRMTESDLVRIVKRLINEQPFYENNIPNDIRRRATIINQVFEDTIDSIEIDPNDYSDEFEYADNMIRYTIIELSRITNDDYYDVNGHNVVDYIKERYGDILLDKYRSEVPDDDDEI